MKDYIEILQRGTQDEEVKIFPGIIDELLLVDLKTIHKCTLYGISKLYLQMYVYTYTYACNNSAKGSCELKESDELHI